MEVPDAGITKSCASDHTSRHAHCTHGETEAQRDWEPQRETDCGSFGTPGRRGIRLWVPARPPGEGARATPLPDLARGPRTRPAHAYLTALLLHFPRRAHKARLQQMLVDQGKQFPPLPGLSHGHDLRPDSSPAHPTSVHAGHFPRALRPHEPHFRLLFRPATRHAGKCSLIFWRGSGTGG